MMKNVIVPAFVLLYSVVYAQTDQDTTQVFKKRVLETTEIDFLTSYYSQDGKNAAVSGGKGTEYLTDFTANLVVSLPLNDDDVLTVDAGISAYTSASSSNVGPFDGGSPADPFQASTGASQTDLWKSVSGSYAHSSDDRNKIWSVKLSFASEFDYNSIGFGGSYTRLFNEKNTVVSISGNVYIDNWRTIYPTELRPFGKGGSGLSSPLFASNTIKGNKNYNPKFKPFDNKGRNSYSFGLGFSQILHKNLQSSLALDIVQQKGLLSTPFQRVYFRDVADSFIENFQLADAIETLPDSRIKVATGGRLHWYLNEYFTARTFYRYYSDDWGIVSHTASLELPTKISQKFTIYPSYRFYNQTATDYFRPHEKALSTEKFYTSDYDLSKYSANQFGFGITYTDIFTKTHLWKFGIKSIDLKYYNYSRSNTLKYSLITLGIKFVMD